MTMTDERLAELDAVMARATAGEWGVWAEPCAHPSSAQQELVQQVAQTEGFVGALYLIDAGGKCPATTGCGPTSAANADAIVALHNAYPDLKALIDAQAATIARLESELEKTTHPHFWWDVNDSENGCDDITSILDNYEIGEVVELSCARDLPNQWAVGYVTESGGFRGQTFATEAEAVAFAAERAALAGAA